MSYTNQTGSAPPPRNHKGQFIKKPLTYSICVELEDENLYLLSVFKAFNDFIYEEKNVQQPNFSACRLEENIRAARSLFKDHRYNLKYDVVWVTTECGKLGFDEPPDYPHYWSDRVTYEYKQR